MKLFPGQVEKLTLNIDQVRCLNSSVRSDVFYSFSSTHPSSVAEIAKGLYKSAQTVHYHVSELINAGLLLPAATRPRRSRTEILYVRSAILTMFEGPAAGKEYNAMRERGFQFQTKAMVRETAGYYKVAEVDPSMADFSAYSHATLLMTKKQVQAFNKKVKTWIDELIAEQPEEGGVKMHVVLYGRPTQGQSLEWAEKMGLVEADDTEEPE